MKNKRHSVGLQGGSSLMVIFGVLCLVVFAVLTLSAAQAGEKLQYASLEAANAYYAADNAAQEKIAELRENKEDGTHDFAIGVTDRQTLEVSVKIDGNKYEILRYQTVYTADWQSDDSLLIWDGN